MRARAAFKTSEPLYQPGIEPGMWELIGYESTAAAETNSRVRQALKTSEQEAEALAAQHRLATLRGLTPQAALQHLMQMEPYLHRDRARRRAQFTLWTTGTYWAFSDIDDGALVSALMADGFCSVNQDDYVSPT